jgi:Ca2+-binding EF-hand superfamily protein
MAGRETMERTGHAHSGHAHSGRGGWRERRMARRMAILDTNSDGKVTQAEIEGELKRLIAAADVNGDGKLSADEFRRRGRWFLRLRTVSFFDMLDADGDGQVSAAEMLSPTGRWFKRHDEDKDKALSGEELNKSSWHHGRGRGRGNRHR